MVRAGVAARPSEPAEQVITMGMSDTSINAFNLKIRTSPWYQEWFKQKGLNPNQVKLSSQQREELKQVVEQHTGFQFPGDMKIDPAGNLNEKGGWAGLPKAVKIGIIAAAAVGGGAALGAFGGVGGSSSAAAGGGSSAAAGGSTAALGAVPELGIGSLSSVLGTGSGLSGAGAGLGTAGAWTGAGGSAMMGGASMGPTIAGKASPSLMSRIAGYAKNPLVQAGSRMLTGAGSAAAQNRGAEAALRMDHDAMGLQRDQLKLAAEKSGRDAQSDAMNKAVWGNYVANHKSAVPEDVSPYARIREVSEGEREAGRLLAEQARQKMESGQYTDVNPSITPFEQYPSQPGVMERIANYAGPAMSLFDPRLYDEMGWGER